jgi:hypothetical protein
LLSVMRKKDSKFVFSLPSPLFPSQYEESIPYTVYFFLRKRKLRLKSLGFGGLTFDTSLFVYKKHVPKQSYLNFLSWGLEKSVGFLYAYWWRKPLHGFFHSFCPQGSSHVPHIRFSTSITILQACFQSSASYSTAFAEEKDAYCTYSVH